MPSYQPPIPPTVLHYRTDTRTIRRYSTDLHSLIAEATLESHSLPTISDLTNINIESQVQQHVTTAEWNVTKTSDTIITEYYADYEASSSEKRRLDCSPVTERCHSNSRIHIYSSCSLDILPVTRYFKYIKRFYENSKPSCPLFGRTGYFISKIAVLWLMMVRLIVQLALPC